MINTTPPSLSNVNAKIALLQNGGRPKTETAKLEELTVVPGEAVELSSGQGAETTAALQVANAPALETDKVKLEPGTTPTPPPPTILTMEIGSPAEIEAASTMPQDGPFQVMTRALDAKASSDAHWSAGLDAFMALPDDDKAAAGKRAFYTQAAMLPEFAETLAGLPADQQHLFPSMIYGAKQAGAINHLDLDKMVKEWSDKNPEQAFMAQMSGFADFAGEQLAVEAGKQNIQDRAELKIGPREQALIDLANHGNDYVMDRSAYLGGVHQLHSAGLKDFARQVLDA